MNTLQSATVDGGGGDGGDGGGVRAPPPLHRKIALRGKRSEGALAVIGDGRTRTDGRSAGWLKVEEEEEDDWRRRRVA